MLVAALTAFDLGVLHKEDRELGIGESLKLSVFYIGVALLFSGWVWYARGPEPGMQYYTGFFIKPPERLIKLAGVCRSVGLGKSMIYDMIKQGAVSPSLQDRALRIALERTRGRRMDRRRQGRLRGRATQGIGSASRA